MGIKSSAQLSAHHRSIFKIQDQEDSTAPSAAVVRGQRALRRTLKNSFRLYTSFMICYTALLTSHQDAISRRRPLNWSSLCRGL